MATLTVGEFPAPDEAQNAVGTLEQLQSEGLTKTHDAAVVAGEEANNKPTTRQLNDLAGSGALVGSFWGLLFGLLFFVPLLGVALGDDARRFGAVRDDAGRGARQGPRGVRRLSMKSRGYEIRVRGELTYALANALAAMGWTIDTDDGATVIGGHVRDQAELSGVLDALATISLELLEVRQLDDRGDIS